MRNADHPFEDNVDNAADLFESQEYYTDLLDLDDDTRLCSDEELRDACDCVLAAMH